MIDTSEPILILVPPRPKIVHMAKHVRGDGSVSPLCAVKRRAINLKVASWTMQDHLVTCEKCKKALTDD